MPSKPVIGPTVGLLRRLGAIAYDSLLLIPLWMLAEVPLLAIPETVHHWPLTRHLIQVYLLIVACGFFSWFWCHGGQTLGMRAWRIKLVSPDGSAVSPKQAIIRCGAAILSWTVLGLGYLWSLVDQNGLTWHDRISKTRLLFMPKDRN